MTATFDEVDIKSRPATRVTLSPTFWNQVEITGFCWLWCGRAKNGYGFFCGSLVHRLSYVELVGTIPAGLEIDHLCRVKNCINPDHLEPVTRLENIRRRNMLYNWCKHGHRFTKENTKIGQGGRRQCRACWRRRTAEYQRRLVLRRQGGGA